MDIETNTNDPPASAGTRAAVARMMTESSEAEGVDEGGSGDVAEPREAEAAPAAPLNGHQPDLRGPATDDDAPPAVPAPLAPAVLRAPASWRGGPKAMWDKLPREVQEESIRLDIETKKVLQSSAEARKEAAAWREAAAPHAELLQQEGMTPPQAFGALVGLYAGLATGSPEQRTRIIASLIKGSIGVDEASIRALAAELGDVDATVPRPGAPAAPAPAAGLTPQQAEEIAQRRVRDAIDQHDRQSALQDLAAFRSTNPEFFGKVAPEFTAAVTAMRLRNGGRRLSIDDFKRAHDQALRLNPETAPILKQRDDAAASTAANAKAVKDAAAAASLKSEPTMMGSDADAQPKNTRDQVRLQMQIAGRRGRI